MLNRNQSYDIFQISDICDINKAIVLCPWKKYSCESYLTRLCIFTDDYIIISGKLGRIVIDIQDSNTNWNVAH